MSFTDVTFFPFIFVAIFMYFTVFRKKQWICLLLFSLIFYILNGPKYIVCILFTSASTYLIARKIDSLSSKATKETKKKIAKQKKFWLMIDLVLNIGILCVFKYGVQFTSISLVMPLGISFYTFTSIGYLLDVYWKRYPAEKNYLHYLLFASYFPHIVQGPISRYNLLSPQLLEKHSFDYERVKRGGLLFLWGYIEKMVIADRLAIFAKGVYAADDVSGVPLLIAITFFSIQLYMDFQGCMDIARGMSEIMGIELEKNFNHPFFSKSMPEFWRRWHITLCAWFKDYLLFPVSMSGLCKWINKKTRKKWGNEISRIYASIIPTIVVWAVTGIWHGSSVNYLIWGVYHGILIISSTVFEKPVQKFTALLKINTETFCFRLFQMVRTFILSAIGRIFFLTTSFAGAISIMRRTFTLKGISLYTLFDQSLYTYGLNATEFWFSVVLCIGLIAIGMMQEKFVIRDKIMEQNLVFRWTCYLILVFSLVVFGVYGSGYNAAAFVYGAF